MEKQCKNRIKWTWKVTTQKWRENGQTKEFGEIIPICCVKLYDHVPK